MNETTRATQAAGNIFPAVGSSGKFESLLTYLAVGALAGAVIALQIVVIRIFSIGNWAHFGSFVVSLAMLAFGLSSSIMCIKTAWFEQHWKSVASFCLVIFGPLSIVCNLLAQQYPFNAIFIISDPAQKWRLAANFILYLLPFLAAAMFLGTVFLRAKTNFSRTYFADLTGSGLCGVLILIAMFALSPQDLILVPLVIGLFAALCWFFVTRQFRTALVAIILTIASAAFHHYSAPVFDLSTLATSDYKGVAYARKFPDSQKILEKNSPYGFLEIYASSYLHFAPGLSDNAAFDSAPIPENSYLGLYLDGEGPSGIMRELSSEQKQSFRYLPMYYPYVLKRDADVFISQFGGGISSFVALAAGATRVTVAEGNPTILSAFRDNADIRSFTGDILNNPHIRVVDFDGRLYLAHTAERFDVVDLSLADSSGLSSPGGFAIVEKYAYTREAMASYMRALKDDGVLCVTLWNKEEPPKSILRLYATMAEAARQIGDVDISRHFFVTSTYLSSATVLYKRDGFTAVEIEKLRKQTKDLSFDEIYFPGSNFDTSSAAQIMDSYRQQIFGDGLEGADQLQDGSQPDSIADSPSSEPTVDVLPPTVLGREVWKQLVANKFDEFQDHYVFDIHPLTNDRPYFAAYLKSSDLPNVLDRLEILQDEWGYLVTWATLAIAIGAALLLVLMPLAFGWRTIFSSYPGKFGTIIYFGCLGIGYIMVEVGLISSFVQSLSHPTVSVSILITAMLVFSGIGSFVAGRFIDRAHLVMPAVLVAIAMILVLYANYLSMIFDAIGGLPYGAKLGISFLLVFPPAFLMGFPMAVAMTVLGRLKKDNMFIWAWGINGCFSVSGAALVPIIATGFGLSSVLIVSGLAYFIAAPAFFAVLKPLHPSLTVSRG